MLSIIIPTLGQREQAFTRLLDSLQAQTKTEMELVVVSQANHDKVSRWLANTPLAHIHVQMKERGLSKARNRGLSHITGDIVTFSDDDCWYPAHAVATAYERMENGVDACCFQIYDPVRNEPYKHYHSKSVASVKGRRIFRTSSIELFFRKDSIQTLRFHESFGLGSRYPSGEENLFLKQFIKNDKQLTYYPEVIVYHEKPTPQSRLSESQLISKGPLFKAMYNAPVGFLFLTALFVKKARFIDGFASNYAKAVKELIVFANREVK
ncbi:glycosyltransferase family 2 protein [Shouchella sp. JSM 1781072]|uniref:glycosyltransferase family 2 protein n=1 Tax=Shouchella sp. JSM 1781072 TaxID=3344581 RepID=UPI0035C1168E